MLVTVGTDHHPFDRLVDWVDRWAADHPDARVVVQHGTAPAPRHAEGHALLAAGRSRPCAPAPGLVVHAGPATVRDARAAGRLPVVVPRGPALGEHVDGHQQRFSRRLGSQELVLLCEQREQLVAALDAARRDPAHVLFSQEGREDLVEGAVARFGELVDALVAERSARAACAAGTPAGGAPAGLNGRTPLDLRSSARWDERALRRSDGPP